jgi:hypothetical protein
VIFGRYVADLRGSCVTRGYAKLNPDLRYLHIDTTPLRTDFTFRSSHAFPSSQESEMDMSDHSGSNSNITTIPSMRVEVVPRRSSNRQFSRTNSRPSSNLGSGAGFKRRLPFGDYFDISGSWNERKDGFGGSKRNRFS